MLPVASQSLLSGLVPGTNCTIDHRIGPLEDGTPLFTLTCAVATPNVQVQGDLTLEIGVPWVRGNGKETTVLIWLAVNAMNKAVTDALITLSTFC